MGEPARVDPKTGKLVATITVGNGPSGIAAGAGAGWVANTLDGTVSRIDPDTNSVTNVKQTGNGPTAVAVGAHAVWVSNQFDRTLARIDPRTNQVRKINVGNRPYGMAISGGTVLVAVRHSSASHRGGTLRMRMNARPNSAPLDSIDTAVAYFSNSWRILRMTGDGLVAFNQTSGLAGTQLLPDLAVSLPAPTGGGRTYAFRLRNGIRYSNGRPVKASDFRLKRWVPQRTRAVIAGRWLSVRLCSTLGGDTHTTRHIRKELDRVCRGFLQSEQTTFCESVARAFRTE